MTPPGSSRHLRRSKGSDGAPNPATTENQHQQKEAGEHIDAKLAQVAKGKATQLFRNGDYMRACKNYSFALRLLPARSASSAILLSNRSAAFAKLGQWDRALEDAEAAIRIDGNNGKFWCRKGAALVGSNQAGEAVKAYKRASAVEPGYQGAAAGLAAAKEAIREGQRRYAAMWGSPAEA